MMRFSKCLYAKNGFSRKHRTSLVCPGCRYGQMEMLFDYAAEADSSSWSEWEHSCGFRARVLYKGGQLPINRARFVLTDRGGRA
jgi:hypothetical protein